MSVKFAFHTTAIHLFPRTVGKSEHQPDFKGSSRFSSFHAVCNMYLFPSPAQTMLGRNGNAYKYPNDHCQQKKVFEIFWKNRGPTQRDYSEEKQWERHGDSLCSSDNENTEQGSHGSKENVHTLTLKVVFHSAPQHTTKERLILYFLRTILSLCFHLNMYFSWLLVAHDASTLTEAASRVFWLFLFLAIIE